MEQQLTSEVIVTSDRLVPCETSAESVLLRAMRDVRPTLSSYGSPTCSDWVFLRHLDVVKCGPGTSRLSHSPDEHVDLHEVSEAVAFYHELAMELLR
jgi:acetylornithine deacetylase